MSKEYTGKKGFDIIKSEHFDIQRKIVANMTTESWMSIPHVTSIYEPDATEYMKVFNSINESGKHPEKITINTLMLRTIVEGIKACPAINAHIEYSRFLVRGRVEQYKDINISMPMRLSDGGMMTINLHNFENKSLDKMVEYIADVNRRLEKTIMSEAMYEVSLDNTLNSLKRLKFATAIGRLVGAKTGKYRVRTLTGKEKRDYLKIPECDRLTKKDIEQGTITVSNFGSIYRGNCTAELIEVIPPQVMAIAVSPVVQKPGIYTDENGEQKLGIRSFIPLCLSFDHRALDYGDIIPFLNKLDEIFQNPSVMETW